MNIAVPTNGWIQSLAPNGCQMVLFVYNPKIVRPTSLRNTMIPRATVCPYFHRYEIK